MKLAIAILTVALLLVPSVASAHTGSITDTQKCATGTTVTAHLDDNVADTSTWTVTIDGSVRDQGSGPGPADLGPYSAGHKAGSATLDITFGDEHHEYTTSWPAVAPCRVVRPRAAISPTCGDPMARPIFDNRLSNVPVTFQFIFTRFRDHELVDLYRTVPARTRVVGAYRHVLGSTVMGITVGDHLLVSRRMEPPGSYGACPA